MCVSIIIFATTTVDVTNTNQQELEIRWHWDLRETVEPERLHALITVFNGVVKMTRTYTSLVYSRLHYNT